MAKYKIAWMPGDGVGNDVMEAARIVLDRMKLDADYVPCDIGWQFWCKEGNALPDRTVKALKDTTCAGTKIANPSGMDVAIDQVVFRENTEGMYGGVEFFPLPESVYTALCASPKMKKWINKGLENVALSTRIMSKQGCSNICSQAFEFAKKTGRKRVTLIEKPNVLRETGGLMTRCFRDVAEGYPDIWADEVNIDAICMWMLKNPQDYSVLVAENMFGDIVSDLCAGLVGGLGFAPSANLGDNYAVFEPTHGSAPKYAGQYKVNPIAMLLTAKLMLDWLKETEMATRLETAIARVIAEGKVRTYDMGGKDSTLDVAKAIADYASS